MYVDFHLLEDHLILLTVLILLSFWCACAANGTVRAAIWTIPVTVAITVASAGGVLLGEGLARTTGTLTELVVSSFHLSPLAFTTVTEFARTRVLWLFLPTLLLALAQSYRLFRTQPDGSALGMLRCTLPLAVVTILWSSSAYAGLCPQGGSRSQKSDEHSTNLRLSRRIANSPGRIWPNALV